MPQGLDEGKCSYLGRSWTRFGISIDQEVSRYHSTCKKKMEPKSEIENGRDGSDYTGRVEH